MGCGKFSGYNVERGYILELELTSGSVAASRNTVDMVVRIKSPNAIENDTMPVFHPYLREPKYSATCETIVAYVVP